MQLTRDQTKEERVNIKILEYYYYIFCHFIYSKINIVLESCALLALVCRVTSICSL